MKKIVKTLKVAHNFARKVADLRYPRIHSVKFGVAGGIVTALCVFVMALFEIYSSNSFGLISGIYGSFGYSVGFPGAILSAIYGFIDGFILTWLFAWIYNRIL